jgi:hypothetical protein
MWTKTRQLRLRVVQNILDCVSDDVKNIVACHSRSASVADSTTRPLMLDRRFKSAQSRHSPFSGI